MESRVQSSPITFMHVSPNMRVAGLILDQPRRWNLDLMNNFFTESTANNTKIIHLAQVCDSDDYAWLPDAKGKHSVK